MLHHEFDEEKGLLVISPEGPLTAEDFKALVAVIDPYIASHGGLTGLVIDAARFPGWENWDAFVTHINTIRTHERKIGRIAVVSDSTVLTVMPQLIKIFLKPEVKHFAHDQRDAAIAWAGETRPAAG